MDKLHASVYYIYIMYTPYGDSTTIMYVAELVGLTYCYIYNSIVKSSTSNVISEHEIRWEKCKDIVSE